MDNCIETVYKFQEHTYIDTNLSRENYRFINLESELFPIKFTINYDGLTHTLIL